MNAKADAQLVDEFKVTQRLSGNHERVVGNSDGTRIGESSVRIGGDSTETRHSLPIH